MSQCALRCVRDPKDVAQTCHRAAGSGFLNGGSRGHVRVNRCLPAASFKVKRKAEKKKPERANGFIVEGVWNNLEQRPGWQTGGRFSSRRCQTVSGWCLGQVLQTLGTETYRPSSASQCVAGIACAEIPMNQWPELIPQLVANVTNQHSTEHMKESTLEAIGYICQDIVSRF